MRTKLSAIIKRFIKEVIEAFRPKYAGWHSSIRYQNELLEDKQSKSDGTTPHTEEQLPDKSSVPGRLMPQVTASPEIEAKNAEIASLKAQLSLLEKEIRDTESYAQAVAKIKKAIESPPPTPSKRGRKRKARERREVKIDTVLLVIVEYARTLDLYAGDFSSLLNDALDSFLQANYPAAYSIYESVKQEQAGIMNKQETDKI